MRRLHGAEEAEGFFTRRSWALDDPLPDQIRDSVKRIFGEDLTALQVAARIIADVRRDGDRAILRHSGEIDGVELEFIEVPADEMEAMRAMVLEIMPAAMELSVPLKVDVKSGYNWGELN